MAVIEIAKIQVRRGQELQTGVPQLDPGELGWAQDTEHLYIGKRISEGASTDENSRILTDSDLENIFNLIGSTVTQVTPYQYRENAVHITASPTTVQVKLDNAVSLTDYGVNASSTATDITIQFQNAVQNIFANAELLDARRKLLIPAGFYILSDTVELPPYTQLEGEGEGLTTITFNNSTTNMFRTVDADGNNFNDTMQSGVKRSREVVVKGMTLEYQSTSNSSFALLSLDNVLNAKVENVEFRTGIDTTSTTTYGLVSKGIGIAIRGTGGGIGSGDANLCENIFITNCKFDSLLTGVEGTGSVVRTVIDNSVFNNLDRGVKMHTLNTLPAPSNGHFHNNRFQNIVKEAIFLGTSTVSSNNVSEHNFFIQVGNGSSLDDSISTSAYPVIRSYSVGNKSVHDHFQRKFVANSTSTTSTFYYNPLVSGEGVTVIDDTLTSITVKNVSNVTRFYLTGENQKVDLNYKLYTSNGDYARTGQLLVNISGLDQEASISDYYNFSYTTNWENTATSGGFSADPDTAVFTCDTANNNYLQLKFDPTLWTTSTTFNLQYQLHQST